MASASDAPRDGGAAATVTTTFFLVRHGETPWNVEGVMQGQEDVPLNAAGWAQAHAAGVYLASTYGGTAGGEWLLVASDLTRATDTARAIGGQMSLPVYTLPALRETHLGAWRAAVPSHATPRCAPMCASPHPPLCRRLAGAHVARGAGDVAG